MIMRSAAHNQHNRVLAVFWRVMGFNCHRISFLIFDKHHAATLALVQNRRCGCGNKGGERVQSNCLAWFFVEVGQTLVLVVALQ
jgi:hypothetical protein